MSRCAVMARLAPVCMVAVGCIACGEHDSASHSTQSALAACPQLDASACQSPAPSYANDIAPLLDRDCNDTCHSPDANGPWPLTDHQDIVDWTDLIVRDTENCTMPPADAGTGALTPDERTMLIDWFACGAPNN